MKTKKGIPIHEELSAALKADDKMKAKWDVLRPSCQADYVELVSKSSGAKERASRIKRVLEMTDDYYQRHPEKHKSNKDSK